MCIQLGRPGDGKGVGLDHRPRVIGRAHQVQCAADVVVDPVRCQRNFHRRVRQVQERPARRGIDAQRPGEVGRPALADGRDGRVVGVEDRGGDAEREFLVADVLFAVARRGRDRTGGGEGGHRLSRVDRRFDAEHDVANLGPGVFIGILEVAGDRGAEVVEVGDEPVNRGEIGVDGLRVDVQRIGLDGSVLADFGDRIGLHMRHGQVE